MKWYIGQKILCIKNHSKNVVTKGQEFIVLGVLAPDCVCNLYALNIGYPTDFAIFKCPDCSAMQDYSKESIYWFCETLFIPIEYLENSIFNTIKEKKYDGFYF